MLWMVGSVAFVFSQSAYGHNEARNYSIVMLNNPFNMSVGLHIKCNWDGKKWKVNKKRIIHGKTKVLERIPNNSNCQIWPYR